MSQDDRLAYDRALERARAAAYGVGEFVGQESFMRASEILDLARRAAVSEATSVLDVCCGVAGPGRHITRELGCAYLGVDCSAAAVTIARDRARGLSCRFVASCVPPLPHGSYDVVLLFETMLAFPDKEQLFEEVAAVLNAGGRFVFTVEEGEPLTDAERAMMPHAETVWLIPLPELTHQLEDAGLHVRWLADHTESHQAAAESLLNSYAFDAQQIVTHLGRSTFDDLLDAHVLWSDWLQSRRVRKFAGIAEKAAG